LTERYDSGQNVVATKIYYQGYEVAHSKIDCDFQDNEDIDTVCISVKKDEKSETLTQLT